jgi:hypothetical protein
MDFDELKADVKWLGDFQPEGRNLGACSVDFGPPSLDVGNSKLGAAEIVEDNNSAKSGSDICQVDRVIDV